MADDAGLAHVMGLFVLVLLVNITLEGWAYNLMVMEGDTWQSERHRIQYSTLL